MSKDLLLSESEHRYTLFPIKHHDVWQMYKQQQALHWNAEELDFTDDKFDQLNPNEQHFIKHVLAFFSSSDGIVSENLALNFLSEVKMLEAQYYYAFQMMMENVHSEVYSLLIDTYVKSTEEKAKLFDAITHFPAIAKKANWAIKWINNGTFAEKLVAFSAVEGIFFSGSFCAIFWLKDKGLLPGLCSSNEFISRDEGMHCDFATFLYNNYLVDKLPPERVEEIILSALEIEKEFILEALPVSLLGMNSLMMKQYLEYVTDVLLKDYHLSPVFNANQPFKFMEKIALDNKTNFFEKRVTDYQKAGVKGGAESSKMSFDEQI